MDRKISKQVKQQQLKNRVIKYTIAGVIVVGVITILASFIRPSLSIDRLRTGTVDRGDLSISIAATGRIVPIYEEVITSPISSKIVSIFKKSGDLVEVGEAILELDLASMNVDYERQKNSHELSRLRFEQFRQTTENTLIETEMQISISEMQLERTAVLLANERYLDSIGSSTSDKVKQVELEYKVESMQLQQMKQRYDNEKINAQIEIRTREMEFQNEEHNTELLNKTMSEAKVTAPRNATLTWVSDQIGANVSSGEQLAKLSDLSRYKIEGELAEGYADRISIGNRVDFEIGAKLFQGIITNIAPSVDEGVVKFIVTIDDDSNEALRTGLQIDLYVVNSIQGDVLRLDNYSYYVGAGVYEMWVVKGDKAIKHSVTLGESSFDKVEIINGLEADEIVILSDMSRYDDQNSIGVK